MESLIQRARTLLGYMAPREVVLHLAQDGSSREEAFLATVAARLLDGNGANLRSETA